MKKLILICLISLIVFIIFCLLIGNITFLDSIDKFIASLIPSIQINFFVDIAKVMDFVFDTGTMIIVTLILAIFMFFRDSKKQSFFFVITMLVDAALIFISKFFVDRARPLESLISTADASFPSGHTTTAVVFFGLLVYLTWKHESKILRKIVLIIAIILTALIALSRIYLDVHYLSDVLAGLALGLFILTGAIIVKKLLESR